MHIDPISDMLTRIRNGALRHLDKVEMPYSKAKEAVALVLKTSGYVEDVKVYKEKDSKKKGLAITLKYVDGNSTMQSIKRVSKPSLRVYTTASDIDNVVNGYGMYVISTSKGVMSSIDAKKRNLGGEIVCEIY